MKTEKKTRSIATTLDSARLESSLFAMESLCQFYASAKNLMIYIYAQIIYKSYTNHIQAIYINHMHDNKNDIYWETYFSRLTYH